MNSNLAQKLHEQFLRLGYKWKIGGVLMTPTENDIQKTLDMAKKALYAEPVPSQMEVGRLIIRHRRPGKFDAYLHIGELND